ncbi:MAG: CDP-paratose 2-epimerase (CDP-tyvelose 2-epimerase) [Candidatus Magasanikbacteria bacterium GW2011_GWA2_37_8]|uniref:CDP-paratose 2-epimerase (CDP-tyvelose 2-epimerase) n=1 Tax=Candidatus Magasanikbacteria bacterium GW2011_GWA2_37_8 TaxID=1619036 RepID=A0A0G0HPY5_9BACT|nr:MAG: CDP-paratose 2-epimerase (CDP-tyvelose 2-epimerase) [Candidatus Magasanikbacteria bacterium GW2011_GWA2_37_8]
MKYLITGGCGFLGSNLAHHLIATDNNQLVIVDNLSRTGSRSNLDWLKESGEFAFYECDVRNYEDLGEIIKKEMPDVVFHLAGQVAMTTSLQDPIYDFSVNALGTINLLENIRRYDQNAIVVYSSTNKVYGDLEWVNYQENSTRYVSADYPQGFAENVPLSFSSPYGCSKGSADQYMLDYYKVFGVKTVVFRHSSMFGGRQFSTADQGWIGWFCQEALKFVKEPNYSGLTVSGNGKQVRDILFADDMVDLYFAAVDNIDKTAGQCFNIGGGMENSMSILELFDMLEEELKVKIKYTNLPTRVSDQKIFVADLTKIKKYTGWSPRVDKFAGIKKMLDWSIKIMK